jgi:small-conductance mechanosensitive channel
MWRRKDRSGVPAGTQHSWRRLEKHVRPHFRRAIVYSVIALAALITAHQIGGVTAAELRWRLAAYGCAVTVLVFGIMATRSVATEVQRIAVARAGDVAGTPLRLVVLLGGYLILAMSVTDMIGLELRQFLVGGAITGIVLGLAAQPVLSNLFAGLVLLFARPYVPGEQVRVMSGALNGPLKGIIISAGLLYTVLETADGPLNIPNSALLQSAVGPAPADEEEKPDESVRDGYAAGQDDAAVAASIIAGAESGLAASRSDRRPGDND